VAPGHEALSTGASRQVGRRQQVERAQVDVVRAAPPHAEHPEAAPPRRHLVAQPLVEAVGRAEQPAHRSSADDHDRLGVGIAVPQDRQQPAHREHLHVAERRGDRHLLARQRLQHVERSGHGAT